MMMKISKLKAVVQLKASLSSVCVHVGRIRDKFLKDGWTEDTGRSKGDKAEEIVKKQTRNYHVSRWK